MAESLEYRGENKPGMRYQQLGSSKFSVSDLCLGTMTMGSFSTEEESFAILDRYVELGGNFIDTAEVYPVPMNPEYVTRTEKIVGKWFASRPGMRSKVFLATKCAGPSGDLIRQKRQEALGKPVTKRPDTERKFNEESLRMGVEASLKRLQTDCIDVYQLHWPDRYVPLWGSALYKGTHVGRHQHFQNVERPRLDMDATVKVLGKLIEEKKIRAWGVSNETTFGVCSWSEAARRQGVPGPVSIQNDFCFLDRRFETELAEACHSTNHNLGLLVYGALMGGFLTDKYCDGTAPQTVRHLKHPNFQKRYHANLKVVKQYQVIAKKYNMSLATMAVAWCRTRFFTGSVIIGATSLAQLEENMKCCNVELSEACLEEIDAIHRENRNPSVDIKFEAEATDSLTQAIRQKEAEEKKRKSKFEEPAAKKRKAEA